MNPKIEIMIVVDDEGNLNMRTVPDMDILALHQLLSDAQRAILAQLAQPQKRVIAAHAT
jgi:hypothetical protein